MHFLLKKIGCNVGLLFINGALQGIHTAVRGSPDTDLKIAPVAKMKVIDVWMLL